MSTSSERKANTPLKGRNTIKLTRRALMYTQGNPRFVEKGENMGLFPHVAQQKGCGPNFNLQVLKRVLLLRT